MATYKMKPGYGKHWIGGTCYRPGDEIVCNETDLGGAKDKFQLVGAPDSPPQARVVLILEPCSGGWFNVRNGVTHAKLNTKMLREAEARELAGLPPIGEPMETE